VSGDNRVSHGYSYPRTGQFSRFLDSLVDFDRVRFEETGEIAPRWYIERNAMASLHYMLNDMFRQTGTWAQTVHETLATFRRMKTMYSPKHWIKNFTSSLVMNWTAGGVGPMDFVRGALFRSGDYHQSNMLLATWKDSHNPEHLDQFDGDREAMIRTWTTERRGQLRKIEEFLALSGGSTLTGTILDPVTVENMVESMLQGEISIDDVLPGTGRGTQTFDIINKQLRKWATISSVSGKAQMLLFKSETRRELARALHMVAGEYASVEYFFKLAQALHFERKRGLEWSDAVRRGARGTSDYAGVSQVIADWTGNWRGLFKRAEAPGFTEARKETGEGPKELSNSFMRFYFGNVFWMFNAGALPSQFWGMVTHPGRTIAATAFASGTVMALMHALSTDDEDERVREALLEMYGMEQWSLLSREELDGVLDELEKLAGGNTMLSWGGGEFRTSLRDLMHRLLSTQPFRGVAVPRGGRSRVFTTEDIAPLTVRIGLSQSNKLASVLKGHFPEGAEKKAWLAGMAPAAIEGTLGFLYDLVKNHRGETHTEQVTRGVLALARQFGAGLHPITALGAPEMVRLVEAANGKSIYDSVRGISTPEWEAQSLGARMSDVALSEVFPTRGVGAFARTSEAKQVLAAQHLIENLFPKFESNIQGTPTEKTLSRAMRNSMEQLVKLARSAYRDHYHYETALGEGMAINFDQLLWREFGISDDMVFRGTPEGTVGVGPLSGAGAYIRSTYAESEEYGRLTEAAMRRMIRDYIFGDGRYYALLETARRRLMDPSVFERLFKGLMDSSNSEVIDILHRDVVGGGMEDSENLRAYYSVFLAVPHEQIRGVLGRRKTRELYEVFAAHGMLEDWAAPDAAVLEDVFGPKVIDLLPKQAIRTMEKR